jgi:LacI family transcriptional regulator
MADVARQAGVSVATVSKVVNNKDGISPSRVAHVRQVIADLGYEASLGAQSLRSGRSGVVGMLVAEFEPFSTELLKGAALAIRAHEYELLAYSGKGMSGDRLGWERRHISRLSGTLIDGAIIVTPSGVDDRFPTPVVAIDPHLGTSTLPTVKCDSYGGALEATAYLLSLGHRRIGFLGGRADLQSSKDREAGFRAAMADAGISVDADLIDEGGYQPDLSISPARKILTLPADKRPTAIFAANDLSAIKVIEVAESLGLRVPDDISVIGFDNVPEAALFRIPLTTMAQPLQEMGARAMDMLCDLLAGNDVVKNVTMPTTLVERASCAPPAGHIPEDDS